MRSVGTVDRMTICGAGGSHQTEGVHACVFISDLDQFGGTAQFCRVIGLLKQNMVGSMLYYFRTAPISIEGVWFLARWAVSPWQFPHVCEIDCVM